MQIKKEHLINVSSYLLILLLIMASHTGVWKTRTYNGDGVGYGGELRLAVKIDSSGKIRKITVVGHKETEANGGGALKSLPRTIVSEQSLGVAAVSGATVTSRAVLDAVADALRQSGHDPAKYGYISPGELSDGEAIEIAGLPKGSETVAETPLRAEDQAGKVNAVSVNSSGK